MSLFPISVKKLRFFLTTTSYSISSKIWSHHCAYISFFSSLVLCPLFVHYHLFLYFLVLFHPRKLIHCLNFMLLKISVSSEYSMLLPSAQNNWILSIFYCRLLKRTEGGRAGVNSLCQSRWCISPCGTLPLLKHSTSTDSRHPTDTKLWFSKS